MVGLFKKRRTTFISQCLRYLRYVLNDHFVLVLIFLMGFLMVQYSQLLENFPVNHLPIILILGILVVLLLSLGKIATYIEPADKQFLLTKEKEVSYWIRQSTRNSFVQWAIFQTFILVLLAPVFFKLGCGLIAFISFVIVLIVIKWFVMQQKAKLFFDRGSLSWSRSISYEIARKQSILKFFSLFTNVKGVSTSVKRRKYLDTVLKVVKKNHGQTWENLYLRAFLRSSDYFALTLRLFLLSIMSLLLISNHLIAVGLVSLLNYLLFFQLIALHHHFDYQYMANFYPISKDMKSKNLIQLLKKIAYIIVILELLFTFSITGAVLLVVVNVIITELYLPYKIKKMID